MPPALRARAGAEDAAGEERLLRRVRGLLNRLAESNVQKVAADVVALFPTEGRRTVCRAVSEELLAVRCFTLCLFTYFGPGSSAEGGIETADIAANVMLV